MRNSITSSNILGFCPLFLLLQRKNKFSEIWRTGSRHLWLSTFLLLFSWRTACLYREHILFSSCPCGWGPAVVQHFDYVDKYLMWSLNSERLFVYHCKTCCPISSALAIKVIFCLCWTQVSGHPSRSVESLRVWLKKHISLNYHQIYCILIVRR